MPVPALVEPIPDIRTAYVGKATRFAHSKDPQDAAWYALNHPEPVDSVVSVILTGPNLSLVNRQAEVMAGGAGVALYLEGGTAYSTYRIRLGVATTTGSVLWHVISMDVVPAGGQAQTAPRVQAQSSAPLATPAGTVMTAYHTVGGHRSLMFDGGGGVVHADPDDPAYQFAGISNEAASAGNALFVVETGRVTEPGWSWTPGGPVYVAAEGLLTQTAPQTGVMHQVAVAVDPTSILVQPYAPILRT